MFADGPDNRTQIRQYAASLFVGPGLDVLPACFGSLAVAVHGWVSLKRTGSQHSLRSVAPSLSILESRRPKRVHGRALRRGYSLSASLSRISFPCRGL